MSNQSERGYDYRHDSDDPYIYEGTHALISKLDIADHSELIRIEGTIAGAAIAPLEADTFQDKFDLAHLQDIHRSLFGEMCEWAGKIQKRRFISKRSSLFCKAEFIEPYAADLFKQLKCERYLAELDLAAFAERILSTYQKLMHCTPFAKETGKTSWLKLNFTLIEPDDLCEAYIASMKDCSSLIELLKRTITPR